LAKILAIDAALGKNTDLDIFETDYHKVSTNALAQVPCKSY